MKNISVIGVGKLGLCFSLTLEKAGYNIIGVDVNREHVESLNNKTFTSSEPSVNKYLQESENFTATTSLKSAVDHSDILFVIVATPSLKNGRYDHKQVDSLINSLEMLKASSKRKHFVVCCTTMPGYCDSIRERMLDLNYEVSYNPEFIALGSVIKDFLNPDMVLIGSSSKEAEKDLIMIYRKFVINKKISPMSLISAEITKISLNSFITLKISFANTLQRLCEKFKYANSYDVTDALGKDKRISNYYFRPGLPFAGPCFPRDNEALNYFQDLIGKKNKFITDATIQSNKEHVNFLNKKIMNYIKKNKFKKILIYGLSFKPNTSLPERSYSLNLVNLFLKKKVNFKIFEKNINYNNGIYKKLKKFLITKKKINSKNFDLLIDVHSLKPKYKISKIDLWNLNF